MTFHNEEENMKIDVLPRKVFVKARESDAGAELLMNYRIIYINSRDESPPFSKESLAHPNLLCLVFDDICNEPSPAWTLVLRGCFHAVMRRGFLSSSRTTQPSGCLSKQAHFFAVICRPPAGKRG